MTTFSVIEYILINLACLILGEDKTSFEKRIELAKASKTKLKEIVKGIKDPDDRALALMAYQQILEAREGIIHTPCLLDWCSSGASILSAIMRDKQGMISCGVLEKDGTPSKKPGNLYQLFTDTLNSFGYSFTKLMVKLVSIPFYYGGDKNVSDLFNGDEKGIAAYHAMYSACLPGAYAFRQAALDAWDSNAASYSFMVPDGYEIEVPVLGDSSKQHICFYYPAKDDEGKLVIVKGNCDVSFKVQEARAKIVTRYGKAFRNSHTKGLGAHMIHALDAYILREIVRMSKLTRAEAEWLMQFLRPSVAINMDLYPVDNSDPVNNIKIIESELEKYSEKLAKKPRFLVFNKIDLDPDGSEERINEIISKLGITDKFYRISALNKENLQDLCQDLMQIVESNAREDLEQQTVSDTDNFIWDEKRTATLDDFSDEEFSEDQDDWTE